MLKRQRLTRQLLPGQNAPKHNSEESNPSRLDNNDGFCQPLIKFILTNKFTLVYQDSYSIRFYLEKKPSPHQSGLAKTN
jgi:hypothetical protein